MASLPIIDVKNLTKAYQLGQILSAKDSVLNAFRRLRGTSVKRRNPFKALVNINFTIDRGEVVGIIGHNGAGKSTLLKIISGVTTVTSGSLVVRGSIAPLIEVGAGLNPELTGRENVFLNGSILGIPKAEIKRRLDEIIAFAELPDFVDTPVKRYSTGMKVRLGFAIATSVQAEILIVDEVLAVGDLAFQRKCFDRMEDLIRRQGNTVLLVSHNVRQVERLCSRVMLLDHGRIIMDDSPGRVCDAYYGLSNEKVKTNAVESQQARMKVRSSGEAEVLSVDVLNPENQETSRLQSHDTLRIRIRFKLHHALTRPEFHVGTHTTDFIYLTGGSTALLDTRPDLDAGNHEIEYSLPSFPLVPGTYCVRFAILDAYRRVIFYGETLKVFSVSYSGGEARQDQLRLIDLPTNWRVDGVSLAGGSHCAPGLEAMSHPCPVADRARGTF